MTLNPSRNNNGSTAKSNGYGTLRAILEAACQKAGCGLGGLTVLSAQVGAIAESW